MLVYQRVPTTYTPWFCPSSLCWCQVIQEEVPSCGADGADVVPEAAPRPRVLCSEGASEGPAAMGINLTPGGLRRISGKWNIGKSPLNGGFFIAIIPQSDPTMNSSKTNQSSYGRSAGKACHIQKVCSRQFPNLQYHWTLVGEKTWGNGLFQHVPNNCHRFP